MRNAMNRAIQRLALSTTALLVAAMLSACSRAPEAPPSPPAVYVHTVAATGAGAPAQTLAATLQARHEVALGFRVGGRVQQRQVEVGQRVRAGQVLAVLDPTDLRLAVQAAAAQAQAAELDASQAQRDAARLDRLVADGSVGTADQERQRLAQAVAQTREAAARAQAQLAQARLGYTQLLAPFDGVVTRAQLEPGQVLAEGQPVLGLARTGPLELQADLPEALATQARSLQARALDRDWRLRELSPSPDPQSRTHRARWVLADSAPPLPWTDTALGRHVDLRLQATGATPNTLRLPASALLARGAATQPEHRVWTLQAGNRLQAQPVQLVDREAEHVRVSGLAAGTRVVVLGAHKLDAGMAVRPVALARPLERPL